MDKSIREQIRLAEIELTKNQFTMTMLGIRFDFKECFNLVNRLKQESVKVGSGCDTAVGLSNDLTQKE